MSGSKLAGAVPAKRRLRIALAGYLITLTFGVVYVAVRVVVPGQDHTVAIGAAVVMSLPLAIAFIGDQIRAVRGFGVEVEIKAVAVSVTDIKVFGSGDITDVLPVFDSAVDTSVVEAGQTGGLPGRIAEIIGSPGCEIVQIDLGAGSYWWPTRLYLLSTLLANYTAVKRVVFVQAPTGTTQSVYAGMAEPSVIVREMERVLPTVAAAYQEAHQSVIDRSGTTAEAVGTARAWPATVAAFAIDEAATPRVSRGWLEVTLPQAWRWAAIENTGDPDSPLLYHRIVTSPEAYTALLSEGRLVRVVDKYRLAASISTEYLRHRLEG